MKGWPRRLVVGLSVLLLIALLVGCAQQAATPTAKPVATYAPAPVGGLAAPTAVPPTAAPAAAATAAPAAPATAAPAAKPKVSGTAYVGAFSEFGTMDPYLQASPEGMYLGSVYDSLMQYDFNGKLVPALATGYKWIDDQTIEYTLRKGVKFQNGDPFTAADVKFSAERSTSPYAAKSGRNAATKEIDRIDVVDDYTIRFHFKAKFPLFPFVVSLVDAPAGFIIVPKNYTEKNGDAYFDQHPIGTGPYKFASRKIGANLILEYNDNWWGPESWDVAPNVKTFEIRILLEAQTRLAALLAGEVDAIPGVDLNNLEVVEAKAGFTAPVVASPAVAKLDINTAIEKIPGTDKPNPFRDKRVRQAIRYAIDVDSMVKSIFKGKAPKSEGPWAPPGEGAHPEKLVTKYTYNPDKAKQLLKEANYPTDLEVSHFFYEGRLGFPEAQKVVDQYLRAVGINVQTRFVDSALVLQQRKDQTLWAFGGWWTRYPYLSPIRTSGLTTNKGLSPAYSMEGDSKVDELVAAAEGAVDPKQRDELWSKVYDYMNENANYAPLFVQPLSFGLSPRVDWKMVPIMEPPAIYRITWKPGYPK